MSQPIPPDLTQFLLDLRSETERDPAAAGRVFELVHGELRRAAAALMRRERPNHTLQPTALVNEAYLRLVDGTRGEWQNCPHVFGIAARAMRQILVDHAREREAEKRGGGWERVTLDERLDVMSHREIDVFELEDVLSRLGEMHERMARIVEFRFITGLTADEVAHVLTISRRTVEREWRVAKMWLARELGGGGES